MKNVQSYGHAVSYSRPDTFITINKSRMKIYPHNEIYLNDEDEFEIEFHNRTTESWLAKIIFNGKASSDLGLVIRPGERTYLDTPDLSNRDKRKFSFKTYEVEKGQGNIIRENGKLEIQFFREKQCSPTITYSGGCSNWYVNNSGGGGTGGNPNFGHPTITCNTGNLQAFNSGGEGRSMSKGAGGSSALYSAQVQPEMEETGRIERGSDSDQSFVYSDLEFENYYSYNIVYKLLPVSKKAITINEVRRYCTGCGKKKKKKERFCPQCGKKF